MTNNVKLTRQTEKELIRDTLIDWMTGTEKDEMIETMVNLLTGKQRKNILQVLETSHNREMTSGLVSLGLEEEEGIYNTSHILL